MEAQSTFLFRVFRHSSLGKLTAVVNSKKVELLLAQLETADAVELMLILLLFWFT